MTSTILASPQARCAATRCTDWTVLTSGWHGRQRRTVAGRRRPVYALGRSWGKLIGGFMGRLPRSKVGRPSAAMLVAVIAVVISLTAPGYAAQLVRTVFFAKKAGNAVKVDGLRASKTPRPNTLLALDSQGELPSSVGAVGPRGLQGVQGPQGARGLQGLQGDRGNVGAPGSALAYSMILFEPPDSGGPAQWRIDDNFSKQLDN